jgi:large subunit ribosomal protein L22
MEVVAKARFVRMSPRKVRLVADLVRGLDVDKAEAQLTFLKKAAAGPVLKVIRSAKANAENNFKLEPEGLFIKRITVDGGPVLHRWRPRAYGRAAPIRKRTSHIVVVLDDRTAKGAPKELAQAVVKPGKGKTKEADKKPADKKTTTSKKPAAKKPAGGTNKDAPAKPKAAPKKK